METRPRLLDLLVFCVGAGSLGAEIAGARLLAPWFGASTIVWANTIAVVLVALSAGYAIGGRWADREPRPERLAQIVLGASMLLAAVPFAARPFLPYAVRAVDEVDAAVFLGSLLGCAVLLGLPMLLLGTVSPYAIRLRASSPATSGTTAGRLYAVSTAGSLVGTFLAALLLIPVLGTRRTFLVLAAAMALAALPHLSRRGPVGVMAPAAIPAAILALTALPVGTIKTDGAEGRVIWERETEYQYARVVQRGDRRVLELNEGHAVHSSWRADSWLTGDYWDEMLAGALAGDSTPPGSVAILGSAAGTTARAIGHYFPDTRVDAVEIDPEVTAVGRRLFGLAGPHLTTYTADARPWLQSTHRRYDAILVDAYRQPYVPFYLTTREFFAVVRDRLSPGGVLVVNAAHPEGSRTLERVLTATMRTSFDEVWRDPAEATNSVLVGTTGGDPRASLRALSSAPEVESLARATAGRLSPGLTGGAVYTDDRAPVEWLIDASFADVAG